MFLYQDLEVTIMDTQQLFLKAVQQLFQLNAKWKEQALQSALSTYLIQ
jgi:hypothetical protein